MKIWGLFYFVGIGIVNIEGFFWVVLDLGIIVYKFFVIRYEIRIKFYYLFSRIIG